MLPARFTALLACGSLLLAAAPSRAQDVDVVMPGEPGEVTSPREPATPSQRVVPSQYVPPPPGYGVPVAAPTSAPPPYGSPLYQPTYPSLLAQDRNSPRYVERTASIKALWIPGMIAFGASYGLSAAFGSLSNSGDYTTWSAIPVIGPWVALGYAGFDAERVGSVVGGVVQVAGLTMFILGLTLKRTAQVPVYSFDAQDPRAPTLALGPLPTGTLGVALNHF